MRLLARFVAPILGLMPLAAQGFEMPRDEATAQFVTSNVISTFYHEVGHGLIDILQLPVLGKEEDAADTLSAVLTHQIWDEEAATQIVYDTAYAYSAYAAEDESDQADLDLAYADTHALDLQRYYNLVCLYYGANPDLRAAAAAELELPEDRAQGCADEFLLAEASWGAMLDGLAPGEGTKGLRLVGADPATDPVAAILAGEIATLNETYGLPEEILVEIAPCGEANAFYDAETRTITLCSEYAEDLARVYSEAE